MGVIMRSPPPPPCERPTLYFVGVSTGNSSIMRVFPRWADILGIDADIRGFDAPPRAERDVYRTIVTHLREDPLARGALVTTHKIELLKASRDLIDELDPHAVTCGEVSCLSKRDGRLIGHAKDPITSAASWRAFVPGGHWQGGAEVLCLGAGGSAVAISVAVSAFEDPTDRPRRMIFVNRGVERLEHLRAVHGTITSDIAFSYIQNQDPRRNDALMADLPPGSMVINATGMGKDHPGSPITDDGVFPEDGLAWELNYRGELDFLHQARRQAAERSLVVEDGWVYFLHGWTAVIAEVFDLEVDDDTFAELDAAAADLRPA
jgi:shikimate dehydrogenase